MTLSAVLEGVKQFARVVLAAVIPIILIGLQSGNIEWRSVITAGVIALLMGLDKWVHEEPKVDAKGILPTFGTTQK